MASKFESGTIETIHETHERTRKMLVIFRDLSWIVFDFPTECFLSGPGVRSQTCLVKRFVLMTFEGEFYKSIKHFRKSHS